MNVLKKLENHEPLEPEDYDEVLAAIKGSTPTEQHLSLLRIKNQELGEMYSQVRALNEQREQLSQIVIDRAVRIDQLEKDLTAARTEFADTAFQD